MTSALRRRWLPRLLALVCALLGILCPTRASATVRASADSRLGLEGQIVQCTYRLALVGPQLASGSPRHQVRRASDPRQRWKGMWRYDVGGVELYDARARLWSPDLGTFLSVDEYDFHDAKSTLWGWPGQNPVRFRDPFGRWGMDDSRADAWGREVTAHPDGPVVQALSAAGLAALLSRLGPFGYILGAGMFVESDKDLPLLGLGGNPMKAGPAAGEACRKEAPVLQSLCFAKGTNVLMADGSTKAIEDVVEGDEVLAHDPNTSSQPEPRKVTQIHRTATYRLFHVEFGDSNGGEILATGSHPFWTQRGWVTAEELTTADVLTDDHDRPVPIRALAVESRDAPTYNLSVEGTHTFYVVAGSTSVLVHNVDPYDVKFSQPNYGPNFSNGPLAGMSVVDAAAQARATGSLPNGLTLNVMEVNGQWVTLNNRTLAVARMANLSNVPINDVGPSGMNQLNKLLGPGGTPVDEAVMRCK